MRELSEARADSRLKSVLPKARFGFSDLLGTSLIPSIFSKANVRLCIECPQCAIPL